MNEIQKRSLVRDFSGPDPSVSADEIIGWLEARGLGWSLDHTGSLIEARIWSWPHAVGRYRPSRVEPLAKMLWMACKNAADSIKEQAPLTTKKQ